MLWGRAIYFIFGLTFCLAQAFSQNKGLVEEFNQNHERFVGFISNENFDSAYVYLQKNEKILESTPLANLIPFHNLDQANYYFSITDNYKSYKYAWKAYNYFKKEKNAKLTIDAVYFICNYYLAVSNFDSSLYYCNKFIPIATENKLEVAKTRMKLIKGRCFLARGDNELASKEYREALTLSQKNKDTLNVFQSLIQLAMTYQEINFEFALDYLNSTRKYSKYFSEKEKSSCYTLFGNIYNNMGYFDSALYYYNKNLVNIDKEKDKVHYGGMIGNIGNVHLSLGNYKKALENQFESLSYFKESADSMDMEIAYGTIADIYLKSNNINKAIEYYNKALGISSRLGLLEELIYNYEGLYQCYESTGNFKGAHESYKLYNKFKDSIRNSEITKKLTEQELTFRFESQKKEQALIQKAKDDLTFEQIKRQKLTIYSGIIAGGLLMVLLILSIRNSNIRKKINLQLSRSYEEIQEQKNIIEYKNREITDSIMYASRIQQGILPDEVDLKNLLPNSFVFFRPRDIVSGDFFWLRKIKGSAKIGFDDLVGIAIADCTGHGVPGAFMSFIGSTIFNQSLENKKIESPADALNFLNTQLPLTLKSKVNTGQINDGMEVGICILNKKTNVLFFAGANIHLIHIRNGISNVIKGDKHSIGLNLEQQKSFTDNTIQLEKNDCIYMFSDGYADQFGGEKGKKYKYKNLIKFLESISSLEINHQYKNLASNFDSWKGDLEQLDDVLVFGLKV